MAAYETYIPKPARENLLATPTLDDQGKYRTELDGGHEHDGTR